MKRLNLCVLCFALLSGLGSCDKNDKVIVVGVTPVPHAEILNSDAVKNYVESKGYTLDIEVYEDYPIPNKALNDGRLDANFFQHQAYLTQEIEQNGYDLSPVCYVHYEPLALYGKEKIEDFTDKTIYTINDSSNAERAFKLLLDNKLIDSYDMSDFDALNPKYTSSINIKVECINSALLASKVKEGSYAVIPGNYALNGFGPELASDYKIYVESEEVAAKSANLVAVKKENEKSEKTNILIEALAQAEVETFIVNTYGPTVSYYFKDLRN